MAASTTVGSEDVPSGTLPAHTKKYKRLTDDQRIAILHLSKAGKTQVEIAQALGCDQATVSRWLSQCQDSSLEATAYLKGRALKMARNIVERGLARDHIQALKGINVLEEQQTQGVTVIVGGGGIVNIGMALSPPPQAALSESLVITEEI